ncbi:hypothetical protein G5714_002715 [Onychostoma macrolepis]|uniref:Uncharacterized protein n=1 Tax=Onychostoma macrolepis TaxID=369639 RepID=A0A7J6D7H2_9TELE|nr:hypothetical protein G5714_002715 [Onychostoma macrolepis]
METQDVLHLLSHWTKTLKSEHRLSLSSQAGGLEHGRICGCLKAGDSGLGICYCLFPHRPEEWTRELERTHGLELALERTHGLELALEWALEQTHGLVRVLDQICGL